MALDIDLVSEAFDGSTSIGERRPGYAKSADLIPVTFGIKGYRRVLKPYRGLLNQKPGEGAIEFDKDAAEIRINGDVPTLIKLPKTDTENTLVELLGEANGSRLGPAALNCLMDSLAIAGITPDAFERVGSSRRNAVIISYVFPTRSEEDLREVVGYFIPSPYNKK